MKKMKKRISKKGFTLVELLVVIAILAVLATVSVVGYLGFTKKAKISNDISLTTQMNTILQAEEAGGETFDTPHDAVEALKNGGLDISKLTPTTNDYSYVYDLKQNRFFLLDETHTKVAPSNQEYTEDSDNKHTQLYAFIGSKSETESGYWKEKNFSFYLKDNFSFSSSSSTARTGKISLADFNLGNPTIQETGDTGSTSNSLEVSTGLDTGSNKNVNVTFKGSVTSNIVIRTYGDQSTVKVEVESTSTSDKKENDAGISVHGYAKEVTVNSSDKDTSVAVAGSCNELTVEAGKVDIEETGIVFTAKVNTTDGSNASIENKGYVEEAKAVKKGNDDKYVVDDTKTPEISGNKPSKDFEISTLKQLEAFRDTVNAGNTFEGKEVKLVSDITLNNGWTPIGEGYREYYNSGSSTSDSSANYFKGTFNGNKHIISNLNNIDYTPTTNRLGNGKDDTSKSYCYGLFALVDAATIKDLTISNVNIDSSRHNSDLMDSVAGLVGFAKGNCNISNITVSGVIKASDAVAGIIGRWYTISSSVELKNCTNYANITSDKKVAGIVGVLQPNKDVSGGSVKLKKCINKGNVTSTTNYWADPMATTPDGYNNIECVDCSNSGIISNTTDSNQYRKLFIDKYNNTNQTE